MDKKLVFYPKNFWPKFSLIRDKFWQSFLYNFLPTFILTKFFWRTFFLPRFFNDQHFFPKMFIDKISFGSFKSNLLTNLVVNYQLDRFTYGGGHDHHFLVAGVLRTPFDTSCENKVGLWTYQRAKPGWPWNVRTGFCQPVWFCTEMH